MKSKLNLALTIILLIGISIGSFFLGKTLGFLSTNQSSIYDIAYNNGDMAGRLEGYDIGYNEGVEEGSSDAMEYIITNSNRIIQWK